jgi:FkbM family methyltransferase
MKHALKKLVRSFGYEVRKYRPTESIETLVAHVLNQRNIDLVVDVGANRGQFGVSLREAGYSGRIISVEPLASAHAQLQERAANDEYWMVADQIALGAKAGEVEINRSANSFSSSILPILSAHTDSSPDASYVARELVSVRRLDNMLDVWGVEPMCPVFLKLDVQGYEDRVLAGIGEKWPQIAGIEIELTMTPLYADQVLHEKILADLKEHGFELYALWGGYFDRVSGRMFQYDALLMRC